MSQQCIISYYISLLLFKLYKREISKHHYKKTGMKFSSKSHRKRWWSMLKTVSFEIGRSFFEETTKKGKYCCLQLRNWEVEHIWNEITTEAYHLIQPKIYPLYYSKIIHLSECTKQYVNSGGYFGLFVDFGNIASCDVIRIKNAVGWLWLDETMCLIIQLWFYALRCNVDLFLTPCCLTSYDKVNPSSQCARMCWFERKEVKLVMKVYWACWKVSLRHQLTCVLFFFHSRRPVCPCSLRQNPFYQWNNGTTSYSLVAGYFFLPQSWPDLTSLSSL